MKLYSSSPFEVRTKPKRALLHSHLITNLVFILCQDVCFSQHFRTACCISARAIKHA